MATEQSTQIAEYNPVEAALTDLRERFDGKVHDVTTTKGMAEAKKDRYELRALRTDLEKKRVEIKKPVLDHSRLIDSEAKRITIELVKLERPIDDVIKAEEKRKAEIKRQKEEAEEKRVLTIRGKIKDMQFLQTQAVGKSAHEIRMLMVSLIDTIVDESYDELREEGEEVKATVSAALQEMHNNQAAAEAEAEALEADRKKLEAEREEQAAEKARLEKVAEEQAEEKAEIQEEREELEAERVEAASELPPTESPAEEQTPALESLSDEDIDSAVAEGVALHVLHGLVTAILDALPMDDQDGTGFQLNPAFIVAIELLREVDMFPSMEGDND